jgi:hypothetical protein
VEVGTGREANCWNGMDHCPIPKHGQVETSAVKRHQFGIEFGNPIHETDNQFLFRPFSDVATLKKVRPIRSSRAIRT